MTLQCPTARELQLDPAPSVLRAAELLRSPYAWPGGYALRPLMGDGGVLCLACLASELPTIGEWRDTDPGWTLEAVDVLWEGPSEPCAHCGELLPSEYGDPEGASVES